MKKLLLIMLFGLAIGMVGCAGELKTPPDENLLSIFKGAKFLFRGTVKSTDTQGTYETCCIVIKENIRYDAQVSNRSEEKHYDAQVEFCKDEVTIHFPKDEREPKTLSLLPQRTKDAKAIEEINKTSHQDSLLGLAKDEFTVFLSDTIEAVDEEKNIFWDITIRDITAKETK